MLDFRLDDTQMEMRNTIRKMFANDFPKEYFRKLDESGDNPLDLWREICKLGFAGLIVPEKYGGYGGDAVDYAVIVEELAYADMTAAFLYQANVKSGAYNLVLFGTDKQKEELLPAIIKGEKLFAIGLTEPNAGSDLASISTKAVKKGNNYIVNGQKTFTTAAHFADYITTLVRTDPTASKPHQGLSVLLIPTNAPGVDIRPLRQLGHRSIHTNEVFLDNVEVPLENLVGEENKGFYQILQPVEYERIGVAAMGVGIASAAYDEAYDFAKNRVQFKKPISSFQAIQNMLVNMRTDIEAARMLTYKAAWMRRENQPCPLEASQAKVFSAEAANRCVNLGMQIMGGYSYMMDYDMQRYYRDVKVLEIGGGTTQILRNIMAKNLDL